MMIQVKKGNPVYGLTSGRNCHKEGDGPEEKSIKNLTKKFEKMQINNNNNNTQGHQVSHHYAEHAYQEELFNEAEKCRTYSMKKFVEVIEPTNGEQYLGYENWKNMIYYY